MTGENIDLFGDDMNLAAGKAKSNKEIDDLFQLADDLSKPVASMLGETDSEGNPKFFLCEPFGSALKIKDDVMGMDLPIFSMKTKDVDLAPVDWEWETAGRKNRMTVIPSIIGRANQLDKDLLIYAMSQLSHGLNVGRVDTRVDTEHRTVRFNVYDYLRATGKGTSGREYKRVSEQLLRLRGTTFSTNIKTADVRINGAFGLIDDFRAVEKTGEGDKEVMLAVELTLSKWLFNAVGAREVLTINPAYFKLKRAIDRKVYEIARKYCGNKFNFRISLAILMEKVGSTAEPKEFKRMIKEIITNNSIPDYRLELDAEGFVMIVNSRFYDKITI